MNAEAFWPEDVFSSAEIVELEHAADKVIAEFGQPVKLEIYFERIKAKEFVRSVRRATYHPQSARRIWEFNQYLAEVVAAKLRGDA